MPLIYLQPRNSLNARMLIKGAECNPFGLANVSSRCTVPNYCDPSTAINEGALIAIRVALSGASHGKLQQARRHRATLAQADITSALLSNAQGSLL